MFQRIPGLLLSFLAVLLPALAAELPPETVVLKGHGDTVFAVAWSADGKVVATGSYDRLSRIFDPVTGKLLRSNGGPTGHTNIVLSTSFSPKGDLLATSGGEGAVRIWDVPLKTPARDIAHPTAVAAVAVSSDGKMVAGAEADGSIRIWSAIDGKALQTLPGHPGGTTRLTFQNATSVLYSVGADRYLRVWNATTGQALAAVGAHASPIVAISRFANDQVGTSAEDGSFRMWPGTYPPAKELVKPTDSLTAHYISNDGNTLYTACADKSVRSLTLATGQVIREYAPSASVVTTLHASGTVLAGGSADGTLTLWNIADGKEIARFTAHPGGVAGIASQGGNVLTTAGADGLVRQWTLPIVAARTIAVPDRPTASASTGDGKKFVTGGADKTLRLWNLTGTTPERAFPGHTGPITHVAISRAGETVASASTDGTVRTWDGATGKNAGIVSGHVKPTTALALSPDGTYLASASEDSQIKLWRLPPVPEKTLAHADGVLAQSLSADGSKLLTVAADKQIRIWNLATSQPETTWNAGAPVGAWSYADNGSSFAVALADKSVSVRAKEAELKKLPPFPAAVTAIRHHPAAGPLAVALADNTIRLMNLADGKEVKSLPSGSASLRHLVWSPDGSLLYAAGNEPTVSIRSAVDGTEKGKLAHPVAVKGIAPSRDGSRLAIFGDDKTVSVYSLPDGKLSATIAVGFEIRAVSFRADNLRIAVACVDNAVRIYAADGSLQETAIVDGPATGVSFAPDGKKIYVGGMDKMIRIRTSSFVAQTTRPTPIRSMQFSTGNDRLIVGGANGSIVPLDLATLAEQKPISGSSAAPLVVSAISADGSKVLVAGADLSLKIAGVADGKEISATKLEAVPTLAIFSASGARFAIVSAAPTGQRIRIYDTPSGREMMRLADVAGPVRGISFANDVRTLVAVGDATATAIDLPVTSVGELDASGVTQWLVASNGPQSLSVGKDRRVISRSSNEAKDGKVLETAAADPIVGISRDYTAYALAVGKTLKVRQIADAKELLSLEMPSEAIAVALSADRLKLAVSGADSTVRMYEIATGLLLQFHTFATPVRQLGWVPGQQTAFAADGSKSMGLLPLVVQKVTVPADKPMRHLAYMSGSNYMIAGGDDGILRALNVGLGKEEKKYVSVESPVTAIATPRAGQTIYAAYGDKQIRIFEMADPAVQATFPTTSVIRQLLVHPTLPLLIGLGTDETITVWNINYKAGQPNPEEFGRPVQTIESVEPVRGLSMTDTGVLWSAGAGKLLREWKIAPDVAFRVFSIGGIVDTVRFDPTGTSVAVGGHDGQIRVYDVAKNVLVKQTAVFPAPTATAIYSLAWSGDGKKIAAGGFLPSAKIVDPVAGTVLKEFKAYDEKTFPKGHRDQILSVALSRDGKLLATGSSDRTIRLWNADDGNPIREFPGADMKKSLPTDAQPSHPGWVNCVIFSPDEKFLIAAGTAPKNRSYLSVWSVADGRRIYGAELNAPAIYSLAVSPDGTKLLLGCGASNRRDPASEAYIVPMPK